MKPNNITRTLAEFFPEAEPNEIQRAHDWILDMLDDEQEIFEAGYYAANKMLLPNLPWSYTVLAYYQLPNEKTSVVLTQREYDPYPFVTHKVDRNGGAYWGQYFSDRQEAEQDFLRRAGWRHGVGNAQMNVEGLAITLDADREVFVGRLNNGDYALRFVNQSDVTCIRLTPEACQAVITLFSELNDETN